MMNDYYYYNISSSKNSNKGNPQTSLEDLNNEILLEILCRLPCYVIARSCKTVSKRWYSLISDPLFITQAFLAHHKINEKEPSVAFLLKMWMWDKTDATAMVAPPCFQRTLWSPFLSLKFLPYQSTRVATFKDLILSFGVNPLTGLGLFYICNPLTKQWMVLPPSTIQDKPIEWAVLTYLEGHGFRVVVAYSNKSNAFSWGDTFTNVNLLVYISETCQWRDIDVRFQLEAFNDVHGYLGSVFTGVVCNGTMVCIHNGEYFGAFNPFDVTNTFHGTLTAINLPIPAGDVEILLESDGNLVAFEYTFIHLRSDSEGKLADNLTSGKRMWKLDMRLGNDDKQSPEWELISELDGHINVKGSILTPPDCSGHGHNFLKVIGVHPSKEHLVYVIKDDRNTQHRFILYDTKSKNLVPLTATIPPLNISLSDKLDIPCWPTPIPIPL